MNARLLRTFVGGLVVAAAACHVRPSRAADDAGQPVEVPAPAKLNVAVGMAKIRPDWNYVTPLALSPSGRVLAAVDMNAPTAERLFVWDLQTGRPLAAIDPRQPSATFSSLAVSPAGDYVAATYSSEDNSFFSVWKIQTGKIISHEAIDPIRVENPAFNVHGAGFTANGRSAVCTSEQAVHVVDVPQGSYHVTLVRRPLFPAEHVDSVACSPRWPDQIAVGINDPEGGVSVRRIEDFEVVRALEPSVSAMHVAWSGDGSRIVAVGAVGEIVSWDAESGEHLKTAERGKKDAGAENFVEKLAVSRDGRLAAVKKTTTSELELWNLETGRRIPLKTKVEYPYSFVFSPQEKGPLLVAANAGLALIDPRTGGEYRPRRGGR